MQVARDAHALLFLGVGQAPGEILILCGRHTKALLTLAQGGLGPPPS
jgi:hypothetical protein